MFSFLFFAFFSTFRRTKSRTSFGCCVHNFVALKQSICFHTFTFFVRWPLKQRKEHKTSAQCPAPICFLFPCYIPPLDYKRRSLPLRSRKNCSTFHSVIYWFRFWFIFQRSRNQTMSDVRLCTNTNTHMMNGQRLEKGPNMQKGSIVFFS